MTRISFTMRASRWLCSAALLTSSMLLAPAAAIAQDPPPAPEQPDGGEGAPDAPQTEPPATPENSEQAEQPPPPTESPENPSPNPNPNADPRRGPRRPGAIPGQATPMPANPPGAAEASNAPAETPVPAAHPFVALEISVDGQPSGRLVIELFPDVAPQTVANFLAYVDSGFYNGTIFHRIVQDYILQGGGYTALDAPKKDGLRPPIPNEARPTQRHLRGTVAAARVHRDLGSATSQFFINLTDNRRLDRHNYAVFGKVVEGMELVDKIVEQTAVETSPLESAFQTRPVRPPQVTRVTKLPDGYRPSPAAAGAVPPTPAVQTGAPSGEAAVIPAPAPTPGAPDVSKASESPKQASPPTPRTSRTRRNRPNSGAAPARTSPRAEQSPAGSPEPELDPDSAARERQRRATPARPTTEPLPEKSDPSRR